MRRIFIDSDVVDQDEVGTAESTLEVFLNYPEDFQFDEIVDFAWHEGDKAWEAVKNADEIYANSSLVPLCGYGSYTGSVVVFDVMMQKAIEEDIRGKSIFFMRPYKDIEWDGIDLHNLMDKAFKHNFLYTLEFEDDEYKFNQVDIDKLLREYK